MNKVILSGRLTREPEIRYSSGENAGASKPEAIQTGTASCRSAREGE